MELCKSWTLRRQNRTINVRDNELRSVAGRNRESYKVMDRALELGLNLWDTADVYGFDKGRGLTEEIIGRWMKDRGGNRDNIVLATKLYGPMGDGPNDRGNSAYQHSSGSGCFAHCVDSKQTTSTSYKCTTSIAPLRGKKYGSAFEVLMQPREGPHT